VKEEMAAGGILLPIPYIPADTAVERVNITIERGLLRAIDETAKARGMTRSSFLASAARHELTGA
jgi:metal-responsive CopG/Arc/MetJ family transcriptional regulator